MPKPAQHEEHNINPRNEHTEHDSCIALPTHGSLAEVGIHYAHGDEVEEEVSPVQVGTLGGWVGSRLEAAAGL